MVIADQGGRSGRGERMAIRRRFLGAGCSSLSLAFVLGTFWLLTGWRGIGVAAAVIAGIGGVLSLAGAYFHWQGWD
jgi:hypothetical protein